MQQISRRLGLLTLGHFTVDAYSSFLSPLIPLLIAKLGLSLSEVGVVLGVASFSNSFSQLFFGWTSDRLRRPWFVAFGPLLGAVFLSAVGLAPNLYVLVLFLILGGLGVAAFHPQGVMLAGHTSKRRALAVSLFITGGTLGFALGPLLSVTTVTLFGLERTWMAAFPGLLVSALLLVWFARVPATVHQHHERPALSELRPVATPLTLLFVAVVIRSAVGMSFTNFLSVWLDARSFPLQLTGTLVAAYLGFGALGGFVGGWLAERWSGRGVVIASFLFSAPLYAAFLFLPTGPGLVSLLLGGFVLQSSLPVNVVLGQELSPRHGSTISSLLMGVAWAVGALLMGGVGLLADVIGLRYALLAVSSLLVAGFLCGIALPRRRAVPIPLAPSPAAEVV